MSDVIGLLESYKENANGKAGTYNPLTKSMSDFNNKEELIQFIKSYATYTNNYIGLISYSDTREFKIKCAVHLYNDLSDIEGMGYRYTIGKYNGSYEATAIVNANTKTGLLDKTPCTQESICVIDVSKLQYEILKNPDYKEIIRLV